MKTLIIAGLAGGLLATPALAQNSGSGMQGALQGLLSGNQSQDQTTRNAYERGYQRGYQDGARMANNGRGGGDRAYGSSDRNPSGSGEPAYGAGGQYHNQNYPAQGYGSNMNR